jgi:hypothetical protein
VSFMLSSIWVTDPDADPAMTVSAFGPDG